MFVRLLRAPTIGSFGQSLAYNSKGPIKSLNYQSCQTKPTIVSINSNKILLYPFTVSVNKCSGSCNTIDDPYVRVCVPNEVKNGNVKVFN